jgi:hypothetical protein
VKPANGLIDDLLELRSKISATEQLVARSRLINSWFKVLVIAAPTVLIAAWIASYFVADVINLEAAWTLVGWLCALALITAGILLWAGQANDWFNPRKHELQLDRLYDQQALQFDAERLGLPVRQEIYRGAMTREVFALRGRGDRYRAVNNTFQSLIIVGSLATTTVASLSPVEGPLKWLAVTFSVTVGLAAGFTGFFKYRERAFYLRQTADDIEEQLNAYNLGLTPYDRGSAGERIGELAVRVEAIRVAQQRREQQLDQPKSQSDTN